MLIRFALAGLILAGCTQPGAETGEYSAPDLAPSLQAANAETPPTGDETPPEEPETAPAMSNDDAPKPIEGLPRADGKSFATLDAYLDHLAIGGTMDRPFWEKLKDGRYRWNTGRGMGMTEIKYATREDLLEKYGFSE